MAGEQIITVNVVELEAVKQHVKDLKHQIQQLTEERNNHNVAYLAGYTAGYQDGMSDMRD